MGARLRARRKAKGLSQAALAEAVDVSPNYVSVLERGQKLPTLDTLMRLARALDTSVGELLGEQHVADDWIDEVTTVARTIPRPQRPVALAVLAALATTKLDMRGR